jgi:hypothetical protein
MTPLKNDPSVDPAVRSLLAAAPPPEGLPERHRFENRAAVVPLSTRRAPKIARLALIAAVLAGASGLLAKTKWFSRDEAAPPERSSESAVSAAAPTQSPRRLPLVPPAAASSLEGASESPPSPQRPPPASSSKGTASLDAELSALRDARALLERDPSAALKRARAHEHAFPEARLAIEARILEIEALVRLGRTKEASAQVQKVLSGPGGSLYRERLENLVPAAKQGIGSDEPKP